MASDRDPAFVLGPGLKLPRWCDFGGVPGPLPVGAPANRNRRRANNLPLLTRESRVNTSLGTAFGFRREGRSGMARGLPVAAVPVGRTKRDANVPI